MADTDEIKKNQNEDSQNPEYDIKEILNSYDINKKEEIDSEGNSISKINGSEWSLTMGILEKDKIHSKEILDVDKYWNFYGYVNPKIDIEFYVGVEEIKDGISKTVGKWINVNKLNDNLTYKDEKTGEVTKIANNNNYIVSANITDYGPKELELILYDRNFTDLQKLISSSISFVDEELNKNEDEEIDFKAEVVKGSDIKFLTSPAKITTNIRLRYGYNENRNETVKKGSGYSGVNEDYADNWDENNEAYRWNTVTKNLEINGRTNQSLKTDTVLTSQFQQATLFSNWQYFVIVGIGSNLTNSGIKYTIKGISTEEFALNGYKMYQQYSVIKGKPKTIMATLMNIFNKESDNNGKSPIKLIWADENIDADLAPINGEDVLIDYENGRYSLVTEDVANEIKENTIEPIKDLKEYIKMLIDIKACFSHIEDNHLKDYVYGKNVEYEKNIEKVIDYGKFGTLTDEAPEREFIDFAMWPLYGDNNHIDYRLDTPEGYDENIIEMAIYQKEIAENISYLHDLKGNLNKNWLEDRSSTVKVKDLVKIWLANIAIQAYGLRNIETNTIISGIKEQEARKKEEENDFKKGHFILKDLIDLLNNSFNIRWRISVPGIDTDDIEIIKEQLDLMEKNFFYIPDQNNNWIDKVNSAPITPDQFISEQFVEIYNSWNMLSNNCLYIQSNGLKGIDKLCKSAKFSYSSTNDYPLKLIKTYLHNDMVNDIHFFKDDYDILDDWFNTKAWFVSDKGRIININNIIKFFNHNTTDINIWDPNGADTKDEYLYETLTKYLGDDDIGIVGSKLKVLSNLELNFRNIYDFFINTENFKFKKIIEYRLISDQIGAKPILTKIFEKKDGKYITNGFNISDLTPDKITFSDEEKLCFKLTFKKVNGVKRYFVGEIKCIGDLVNIPADDIQQIRNEIASLLKFIFSFALDILNKNKSLSILNKNKEVESIKIFEDDEEFGKLIVPNNKSMYLDVNKEFLKYLNQIRSVIEKMYNNDIVNNKTIKQLYKDYVNNLEEFKDQKEEVKNLKIREILNRVLEEIRKNNNNAKIINLKINEEDEEEFGKFGEINLLTKAFKILSEDISPASIARTDNSKCISEFLKKVDLKIEELQEVLERLENKNKRINDSNIGKEIELSLGNQESRKIVSDNNQERGMTKTIASLLNDFCSQCMPKISEKELEIKNLSVKELNNSKIINNKIIIKDENGDDKEVEIYQNIPRYNLTWGVVGYYDKTTPIIGFYYKQPKKMPKLRRYNWGTGNNKPHCIKSVNISTGSEFALLHAYNTVTDTSNGQIITAIDNDKQIVREVSNILPGKSPCFFNKSFETNRDKNTFNNMINSLSKGTITVLGDPSLRFSGNIQPYTYPIYLNINLSREMPIWMDAHGSIDEQNNTEFSQLSGYYVITKISHSISTSGYITTLEVMKYPGTGDAFELY